MGILELAVEVISPSSVRLDRFTKRREYQARGVSEYWVVDTSSRSVERWRPGDEEPEILFENLPWHPLPASVPLEIDLIRYFQAVHGE
jgi:Uma2 family endonuclease